MSWIFTSRFWHFGQGRHMTSMEFMGIFPSSFDQYAIFDYHFLAAFLVLCLAAFLRCDIGLPQHQSVCAETPQASITTSLPQGTHERRVPFLSLAIPTPVFI
jgi:hypothetical protein